MMKFRHALIPTYLVFCVLLGGASAAGLAANLLLQLAAIMIFAVIVIARPQAILPRPSRQLVLLLGLLVSFFIVELAPLPPGLWSALPGRESVVGGYQLLDLQLPWVPLSLAPANTVASFVWLFPAIATLLAILIFGGFRSDWIAWSIAGATILSVVVAALQIGGGALSPAYFYTITNRGFGVGFFANANHMATLLLIAVPFLAALAGTAIRSKRTMRRSSGLLVIVAVGLLVVLVGLLINRSLAGWGLAVPVIAASIFMLRTRRPPPRWAVPLVALLSLAALAVVMSAPLGNNLTGNEARTSQNSRHTSFANTIAAAHDFLPWGSGIGTFVSIYRSREIPSAVDRFYMNHAHGDYFEIYLEAGLFGIGLIVVFLLWWVRRAWTIWRRDAEPDLFARASTIASAAVILHSMVDYPLRTAAISSIFAACVALMAEPRPRERAPLASEATGRHLSAD